MSTCVGAQHALRRLDRTDLDVSALARRLDLLAEVLGLDLDQLELVAAVAGRDGNPATWEEMVAIGRDPTTGGPAA